MGNGVQLQVPWKYMVNWKILQPKICLLQQEEQVTSKMHASLKGGLKGLN